MDGKVNQVKWGIVLTYATLFLNILVSVLYTPVMLRLLGSEEHGLYSTVTSAISWVSLLSLGLNSSYIRFYARYKKDGAEQKIASLNGMFLSIFCILGVIAFLCGLYIANNLHFIFADGLTAQEYAKARILAIVVSVELAINFPATIFNSIIRAKENFIAVRLVHLFQCVTSPLVTLPLLLMGYGSVAMVAVTTGVNVVAYSFYIVYSVGKLKAKFRFTNFDSKLIKEIAAYSGVIAINSLITQVNTSLDKVLLARYVNTVCVSVYTIGFSLYSYYSSFSSAITGNLTPRIHKIVAENYSDKPKLKAFLTEQFIKFGRIQLYIQMLMLTGIIFFGKPFIAFWAGPGYENAYYVAVLLCVSATIPLCQDLGIEIQRAQNKHRFRTILSAAMTVVNIVLTVILCQIYGEIGAAVGTAIAVVVVDVFIMNIYYHKKLNVDIIAFWKSIAQVFAGLIPPIIIGALMVKVLPVNTLWHLIAYILLYTIVYGISMLFLSMSAAEREMVFGKVLRKIKKR